MLDRTKKQGFDVLEHQRAFERQVAEILAKQPLTDEERWERYARFDVRRRVAPVAVGDSYENFGSADCEEWGL